MNKLHTLTQRQICPNKNTMHLVHKTQTKNRLQIVHGLATDTLQNSMLWLQLDSNRESQKAVRLLIDNDDFQKLSDMMDTRLEFGTAGLRGLMGPGFNRMNDVTVQQTCQGLCIYLQEVDSDRLYTAGVVIGYDGRHGSRRFAEISASVFSSRNVPVALFSKMVPTPFVAAAVALRGAAAGIMVTASHNPKDYNGYKVYWSNGCQIIPPHDEGIAAAINANLDLWPLDPFSSGNPLLSDPLASVTSAYISRLAACLPKPDERAISTLGPLVYTPLHGVGATYVKEAFQVLGLPALIMVPQQEHPDPEFPTVVFPNPEEGQGVWDLSFQTADRCGANYAIANDPDADRLAAAERQPSGSGWRTFSGNEMGALLAHWCWTSYKKRNPDVPPSRCAMLSSAVSSRFIAAMAAAEGLLWEETLTGFKWLGNRATELEKEGYTVLFAFEEAIGFMLGGMFKDKDGVAMAAAWAMMAAEVVGEGQTLEGRLQDLYDRYGFSEYRSSYFISSAPEQSRAVFERIREGAKYPTALGGAPVVSVRDLGVGLDTSRSDGKALLPWRSGDMMITFTLEGGAVLTLRASGTEPKLKYYLEVVGPDRDKCRATADRLEAAVATELVKPELSGLRCRSK